MRLQSFLLPLIAHSTIVEFPIVADPYHGLPAVRISMDRMTPRDNHTLPIHLGRTSNFAAERDYGNNDPFFNITMEGSGAGTIDSFVVGNREFFSIPAHLTRFLGFGVGPSSTFINHFGSVSIIQNATSPVMLAARSSQDYFESNCFPGSVAVARFDFSYPATIVAHAAFLNEDIPSGSLDSHRIDLANYPYFQTALVLGTEDVYPRFRQRMIGLGAIPSEYNEVFTNCTGYSPDLDMSVHFTGRTAQDMYRIIIEGQDYIHHNSTDNTCRVSWTPGRSLFNPLRVPGLNVRYMGHFQGPEEEYIQFCDSSF